MSKTIIELDREGVRELLRSQALGELLESKAEQMSQQCGTGYEHDVKLMPTRVIASCYADTQEARQDNLDNNTLLKAVK